MIENQSERNEREHLAEEKLMLAALTLYVEDALKHAQGIKSQSYDYEQAYDDITGRQIMLNHLCSFLSIRPEYVTRLFNERLREIRKVQP